MFALFDPRLDAALVKTTRDERGALRAADDELPMSDELLRRLRESGL